MYAETMSKIDERKVRASLESPLGEPPTDIRSFFGDLPIHVVSETGSTNDDLKEAARSGSGCCALLAERQTAGRGRQGRCFFSEGGLYVSAILPPLGEAAPFLTHIAAVAVTQAIRALSGEKAEIKWVNDIFVQGKKVCGILCESVVTERGRAFIAGIGVNTEQPEGGFPAEIANSAGAVRCDKSALAGEILKRLFYLIERFDKETIRKKYQEFCFLTGKEVAVIRSGEEKRATVIGLAEDLGLTVRYEDGLIETLRSGEVQLKLGISDRRMVMKATD